jgi:hypothetical protein
MEKQEAEDAARNAAVHIAAAVVAIQAGHLDHAQAQLSIAGERVDHAACYIDDQLAARLEASH